MKSLIGRIAAAGKPRQTVSKEEVVWCYRNLLRREPESDEVVLAHCKARDFKDLVERFVRSTEFSGQRTADRMPATKQFGSNPKIAEADFRRLVDEYLENRKPPKDQLDYAAMHFKRLLDAINVIHDVLPKGGNLLDYHSTGFFQHAIAQFLPAAQYTSIKGVNYELDEYVSRYGKAKYDLCVNTEVLEHLLYDPSHMIFSINQMLKPGGYLFLSTPNAISMVNCVKAMTGQAPNLWNQLNKASPLYHERHNREWTPFEISIILKEHGFKIVETYANDYYESTKQILSKYPGLCKFIMENSTHGFFGDTVCALARKEREIDAPVHSSWLYVLPGQVGEGR